MPFLTEQGFFTVLLLFQFLQDIAESLWNCHLTNAADGFGELNFRLLPNKLNNASANIHSPFFKIDILPFQTGNLASSGACVNSSSNDGMDVDGLKLSHFEDLGNLFIAEGFNFGCNDFGNLKSARISRIWLDVLLFPSHCHNGLKNGQISTNGSRGEFLALFIYPSRGSG